MKLKAEALYLSVRLFRFILHAWLLSRTIASFFWRIASSTRSLDICFGSSSSSSSSLKLINWSSVDYSVSSHSIILHPRINNNFLQQKWDACYNSASHLLLVEIFELSLHGNTSACGNFLSLAIYSKQIWRSWSAIRGSRHTQNRRPPWTTIARKKNEQKLCWGPHWLWRRTVQVSN